MKNYSNFRTHQLSEFMPFLLLVMAVSLGLVLSILGGCESPKAAPLATPAVAAPAQDCELAAQRVLLDGVVQMPDGATDAVVPLLASPFAPTHLQVNVGVPYRESDDTPIVYGSDSLVDRLSTWGVYEAEPGKWVLHLQRPKGGGALTVSAFVLENVTAGTCIKPSAT